ncbi:MAG: UbiA family prenyltransferase [Crocinitomicaceae bacterium]|nr:UbiA family prenyltransferase [Crocinitomicaceae bacterium]
MIRWIQHLVFSNIVISVGAAALLFFAFQLKGMPNDLVSIGFIFFSTLFMYNLQRMHKMGYQKLNLENARHRWINSNEKSIRILIIFSGLTVGSLTLLFSFDRILMLGGLGVISFLYSYQSKLGNLRSIPGTKIFWIAFVWSVTIFALTLDHFHVNREDWLLLLYNFIFILAITIPFDIRDIDYDEEDYKTIPQLIGVKASRILSFVLIGVAFVILSLLLQDYSIFLSLIYGIFALLCLFSTPSRKELYYSGIMDFTISISAISLYMYLHISFFHF